MSTQPGGPTKIIAFARPAGFILRVPADEADAFPRFRREWNRPNPPTAPIAPPRPVS